MGATRRIETHGKDQKLADVSSNSSKPHVEASLLPTDLRGESFLAVTT